MDGDDFKFVESSLRPLKSLHSDEEPWGLKHALCRAAVLTSCSPTARSALSTPRQVFLNVLQHPSTSA